MTTSELTTVENDGAEHMNWMREHKPVLWAERMLVDAGRAMRRVAVDELRAIMGEVGPSNAQRIDTAQSVSFAASWADTILSPVAVLLTDQAARAIALDQLEKHWARFDDHAKKSRNVHEIVVATALLKYWQECSKALSAIDRAKAA